MSDVPEPDEARREPGHRKPRPRKRRGRENKLNLGRTSWLVYFDDPGGWTGAFDEDGLTRAGSMGSPRSLVRFEAAPSNQSGVG
jgi:hypothetical protein